MTDYTQKAERDKLRNLPMACAHAYNITRGEWGAHSENCQGCVVVHLADACDTLEQRIAALEKALKEAQP